MNLSFLEQKLLDIIKRKSNIDLKELKKGIQEEDDLLKNALDNLVIKGDIYLNKNQNYIPITKESKIQQGKLYFSSNGNGCVTTKNGYKIIIPKKYLTGVVHGDIVTVKNLTCNKEGEVYGTLDKIISRKNNQISCEVIFTNGELKLIPYNEKSKSCIMIDQKELNKHGVGELLLIKLNNNPSVSYDGTFIKKIGHKDDPDIDERAVAYDHGFEIEFSDKSLKQLEKIPSFVDVNKAIKEGRKDLRNKKMFTIDGTDTKDIDDSIGIEELPNGNLKLYVNIADVGYYIKEGTPLYNEAYERTTSVYMNDTVIPMFPPKISNGICSLHPSVNRLTKTCEMIINKDGKIVDYDIYDSIINSSKKMNYDDVNKILIDDEMVFGYEEFIDDLKLMNLLSKKLDDIKKERGYINFDKADINAKGKDENVTFTKRTQRDAEKLIENFMLLANETVASHIFYRGLPFIYRIHEMPDQEKIEDFLNTLSQSDNKYDFKKCKSITTNKFIQDISEQLIKNKDYILLEGLLKSMKKAKYSNLNLQHFGLALKTYTHFTSPIRRFADLKVHKLLDLYSKSQIIDFDELDKILKEITNHVSEKSRDAERAEREALEMRMAEYMSFNIGKTFNTVVTDIWQNVITVRTEEGITGKIKVDDLTDDNYIFHYKDNCLYSKNTGKKIKIGTPILATVKEASKKNRTVKFTTKNLIKNQNSSVKILKKK